MKKKHVPSSSVFPPPLQACARRGVAVLGGLRASDVDVAGAACGATTTMTIALDDPSGARAARRLLVVVENKRGHPYALEDTSGASAARRLSLVVVKNKRGPILTRHTTSVLSTDTTGHRGSLPPSSSSRPL